MAGRKDKGLQKIEPVHVEPVAHDFFPVSLAEITEIVGVDELPLEAVGSDNPVLKPAAVDPFLHIFGADMQRLRKCVSGEPVLPHAGVRSQPVQHGANRSGRAPQLQ